MNKGFTLIELIGVIVILSLLVLLAGGGVTKIVKGSKKDINEAEKLSIMHAAEIYRAKNIDSFGNNNCLSNITVNNLIESKLYKLNDKSKYTTSTPLTICLNSITVGD